MAFTPDELFDKCFKNKKGKVVLWQSPNPLLFAWIGLKILSYLAKHSSVHAGIEATGTAVIFAWAYLELTKGVNYFRKALGGVILILVIKGFFKT